MEFENIEAAKAALVNELIIQHKLLLNNDHRAEQKSIKKAFAINNYIKENFDLRDLKDLLDHKEPNIQIWIANLLLPFYEDVSLRILKKISTAQIPECSFHAAMMLEHWQRKKNN
tara:strand:+ start:3370 stop:3714 length:345 start_codon:yes stop_codon:yes gene_type:complete